MYIKIADREVDHALDVARRCGSPNIDQANQKKLAKLNSEEARTSANFRREVMDPSHKR
jgi:Zn-dependent oligopeptidase